MNLFEHEEQDYYNPVRVSNFWSNNYIEYVSNCDRNKTLSAEEYLNKISVMHSKRINIEIMINGKADEVITTLFESSFNRYQIGLKTSMRGKVFIFDCVHLLHYKFHKDNFKLGESYINYPDWKTKQNKKAINAINKIDNTCF